MCSALVQYNEVVYVTGTGTLRYCAQPLPTNQSSDEEPYQAVERQRDKVPVDVGRAPGRIMPPFLMSCSTSPGSLLVPRFLSYISPDDLGREHNPPVAMNVVKPLVCLLSQNAPPRNTARREWDGMLVHPPPALYVGA